MYIPAFLIAFVLFIAYVFYRASKDDAETMKHLRERADLADELESALFHVALYASNPYDLKKKAFNKAMRTIANSIESDAKGYVKTIKELRANIDFE
ncbi:TPA: hypothetical protein MAN53_004037 [Klebsiella pneumoniae]|uniref:hypothetical protein n=1 Tax=Klebsiella pneumoniae TaxID=573 RepID=UPI0009B94A60|nr:hypothetical protein [Klebsiella pneumoniae]SLO54036.1 Uncharacterised protein [Klebsiella pneumoniae]HBS6726848.1 hypothetical protein [Klebsiella pneumoniae]